MDYFGVWWVFCGFGFALLVWLARCFAFGFAMIVGLFLFRCSAVSIVLINAKFRFYYFLLFNGLVLGCGLVVGLVWVWMMGWLFCWVLGCFWVGCGGFAVLRSYLRG